VEIVLDHNRLWPRIRFGATTTGGAFALLLMLTASPLLGQSFSATVGPPNANYPLTVAATTSGSDCYGPVGGTTDTVYTQPGFPIFTWGQHFLSPLVQTANGQWIAASGSFPRSGGGETTTDVETLSTSGILTITITDTLDSGSTQQQTSAIGTVNLNTGAWTATVIDNVQSQGACSSSVTYTDTATAQLPVTLTAFAGSILIMGPGNRQTGSVGRQLDSPLTVAVADSLGNPVSGVQVSFFIIQQPSGASGASLSIASPYTGAGGTVSTLLTLGSAAGQYEVEAYCASCTPSTVTFVETSLSPTCSAVFNGAIKLLPAGAYMQAELTPAGTTLAIAASACNVDSFDWQQTVAVLPNPVPLDVCSQTAGLCLYANTAPNTPLAAPFADPPLGGYYLGNALLNNNFPFYYNPLLLNTGCALWDGPDKAVCELSITDGNTLNFSDAPILPSLNPLTQSQCQVNSSLPCFTTSSPFASFTTSLVGVVGNNIGPEFFSWNWTSTYYCRSSGYAMTVSNTFPVCPGGAGSVTVTGINGSALSPLSAATISTTASGLAYSRVSRTFDGTVTIANVSGSVVNGPFQIVFMSLPSDVTLADPTGSFYGNPFITVPSITALGPGQTAMVTVQFSNPLNSVVNFTPAIYAGSLN
jgi:hypothetical protein